MKRTVTLRNKKIRTTNLIIAAVIALVLVAITITFVIGEINKSSSEINPNGKTVSAEELVAEPGGYKNFTIEFTGKVFVAEGKAGEQALQVFSDAENSGGNIAVYNYSNEKYAENDYVRVKGTAGNASEGENAFGAKLTVPVVIASSIQKISSDDVIAPAVNTIQLNQVRRIGRLTVTLEKVVYAKGETRLYLKFDNKSASDYDFYGFNTKLIQGRTSIKEKSVYDRGDDDQDSTVAAGTVQKYKLYFDPLQQGAVAKLSAEVTNQTDYESKMLDFSIK